MPNTLCSTTTKYPNLLNGSELDTEECDGVVVVTMAGTDSQIRGQREHGVRVSKVSSNTALCQATLSTVCQCQHCVSIIVSALDSVTCAWCQGGARSPIMSPMILPLISTPCNMQTLTEYQSGVVMYCNIRLDFYGIIMCKISKITIYYYFTSHGPHLYQYLRDPRCVSVQDGDGNIISAQSQ